MAGGREVGKRTPRKVIPYMLYGGIDEMDMQRDVRSEREADMRIRLSCQAYAGRALKVKVLPKLVCNCVYAEVGVVPIVWWLFLSSSITDLLNE